MSSVEPDTSGQAEHSSSDPTHVELEGDNADSSLPNGHLEPYEQILSLSTEPMKKPVGDIPSMPSSGQDTRRWLIFI